MTKKTSEVSPEWEHFQKKVADFQEGYANEMAGFAVQAKQLSTNKREYLYATIQEAFVIGSELMLPENKAVLDKLLEDHGLERDHRAGTNPWMPVTNLLFGQWVTDPKSGLKSFEVDKSAKKYAVSFRYFHEHQWEPETVADELMDPKTKKLKDFGKHFGKGLVGSEKLGRYQHRAKDPDERADEVNRDLLWSKGKPIAIIKGHINNHPHDTQQYVALWGVQRSGNELAIYGELVGASFSKSVEAYLRKAAKEIGDFAAKVADGKQVGKGNRPPGLTGPNIVKPMLQSLVKQYEVTAADFSKLAGEAASNANRTNSPKEVERLLRVSEEIREKRKHVLTEAEHLKSYVARMLPDDWTVSVPDAPISKREPAPAKPRKLRGVKLGGKVQVEREAAHAA